MAYETQYRKLMKIMKWKINGKIDWNKVEDTSDVFDFFNMPFIDKKRLRNKDGKTHNIKFVSNHEGSLNVYFGGVGDIYTDILFKIRPNKASLTDIIKKECYTENYDFYYVPGKLVGDNKERFIEAIRERKDFFRIVGPSQVEILLDKEMEKLGQQKISYGVKEVDWGGISHYYATIPLEKPKRPKGCNAIRYLKGCPQFVSGGFDLNDRLSDIIVYYRIPKEIEERVKNDINKTIGEAIEKSIKDKKEMQTFTVGEVANASRAYEVDSSLLNYLVRG